MSEPRTVVFLGSGRSYRLDAPRFQLVTTGDDPERLAAGRRCP